MSQTDKAFRRDNKRIGVTASVSISSQAADRPAMPDPTTAAETHVLAQAPPELARLFDRRLLWSAVIAHGLYDWLGMTIVFLRGVPASV